MRGIPGPLCRRTVLIMKILSPVKYPNFLMYTVIFTVTQVTGLLLSLVICFILQDFIAGFVRIALVNSFVLGGALAGSCWFTQKMMFRIRTVYSIVISSTLLLGIGITVFFLLLVLEPALFIYYARGASAFLIINFLFIAALYSISCGLIVYREILLDREKTISGERYLRNQMEMKLLASKINPHFLFNTLNMILNLLREPQKAETALLNLSDLLRHNLEQSEKTAVPIGLEIENVRKYLEIQKLRFGDRLEYAITGSADFLVPPLVVQPLVENCIKHNIGDTSCLKIETVFSLENETATVWVADSERKVEPLMVDRGQGLTITRKRVENNNGTFTIKNGGILLSFPRP